MDVKQASEQPEVQDQSSDTRIDAFAAVALILLLVVAAVFWVSGQ